MRSRKLTDAKTTKYLRILARPAVLLIFFIFRAQRLRQALKSVHTRQQGRWILAHLMRRLPIRVECYAGSRADERPHRVIIEDRTHIVARLLAESIEESLVTKAQTRCYRVLTLDGSVLKIVHCNDGRWFLDTNQSADWLDSE